MLIGYAIGNILQKMKQNKPLVQAAKLFFDGVGNEVIIQIMIIFKALFMHSPFHFFLNIFFNIVGNITD
ncbi:hypothetical protein F480_02915 [Bibersteinia trehalosi Y31]|uniref:Uncharacterized protein n=3 Tax=Bibersteinia trehalosi TaxID=47735 RepID=A0A179D0Z3_BIBTR|nr:hypothetical protein F543_16710 [Bibersteinia trehalosi USDA-ARS-USMARC-189]OAQ15819.1 hypothetical protein F480_02915 [Bibersteinia trehalosi Y31]